MNTTKLFALSALQFDAAFAQGVVDATDSVEKTDLVVFLEKLSGRGDEKAIAQWGDMRAAYVAGYETLNPESAGRAWSRMVQASGLKKPQSAQAVAKAAQRAKAKPSEVVTVKSDTLQALVSGGESIANTARESACIELLHGLSDEGLIKAQKYLLTLIERMAA